VTTTAHAQDQPQVDATARRPRGGQRALVLGGGGSTGNAWVIGILAGLFDAGLDVTTADLTIGTSAGSTAAAQLAGATPPDLLAAALASAPPPRSGPAGSGPVVSHLDKLRATIAAASGVADLRRRMGSAALETTAASDGSWQARWHDTVAARLPGQAWPQRAVLITVVDAETGDGLAFDRDSGVDLVDAVAASCAGGGFAYTIGGRRYIDGGYRSNAENADLAAGYARVLVLSPLGGRSLHPPEWGTHLSTQVDALRAGGISVETNIPDRSAEHLFGADAMDPSLRPSAARAGHDQGTALAEELSAFWG
jgi:NTE family protein